MSRRDGRAAACRGDFAQCQIEEFVDRAIPEPEDFDSLRPEERRPPFVIGSLTWSANASDPNRTGFRPLVAEHLRAGKVSPENVWPFDEAHPGDLGYRYFAAAAAAGFDRAVAQGLVCRAPEAPVFGDVSDVARADLGAAPPAGWSAAPAYRTSLWFDGLSSRWLDGVAVFAGTNRAPKPAHDL